MTHGTTPAGTRSEAEASTWVRGMFGRVAPRYDLLNHLLSFNLDRFWRAHAVKRIEVILRRPDARVLDLCCGTGDLLFAMEARRGAAVLGSDFSHPMLVTATRKIADRRCVSTLFEADALTLPLADRSLDLIAVAFGVRNFANYRAGLEEMCRVLRAGGVLAILECSIPPNPLLAAAYRIYSDTILPAVGGLISGSRDAYSYLPESVRKFPTAEELAGEMERAGFSQVQFERLTGGIVALHLGTA